MTTRSAPSLRVRFLLAATAAVLAGCAPSVDQSGWEMARKRSASQRPDAYPDIPVVLPGSPPPSGSWRPTGSPMDGVAQKRLEEGSLFRRGYGAPTP